MREQGTGNREQELREKVIEGLESCGYSRFMDKCQECPYDGKDCFARLKADVLALLREQEAVEPVWHSCDERIGFFACGACGANMGTSPKYCWYCGRKVKWG